MLQFARAGLDGDMEELDLGEDLNIAVGEEVPDDSVISFTGHQGGVPPFYNMISSRHGFFQAPCSV